MQVGASSVSYGHTSHLYASAITVGALCYTLVFFKYGNFISAFINFLCLQGALTHGDRRATESRDLSRFNFDNKVSIVVYLKHKHVTNFGSITRIIERSLYRCIFIVAIAKLG